MIEIDKDIPMPSADDSNSGRRGIYPYSKMDVGDSFLATCKHSPISIAKRWGDPRGIEFISRKDGNGWRVWRVK